MPLVYWILNWEAIDMNVLDPKRVCDTALRALLRVCDTCIVVLASVELTIMLSEVL